MTNATPNAEQQKKLDALLGSPEFVTRAFSSYAESQFDVHRARLRVWQIEATLWMILHVALVAATVFVLLFPDYVQYQWALVLGSVLVSIARAYVAYSFPRP